MRLHALETRLAELPYRPLTSRAGGQLLYELALEADIEDVLELGFAHGTSTAYLAAALHEKGSGRVTTIDRVNAVDRSPNIHALLDHVGLTAWVRPVFAARSYTWELMHFLRDQLAGGLIEPCFEFCFVDGAHTWDVDGFAFLLVDQLLRPDRWIGFDDVNWTLASSPTLKDKARVLELPAEERESAQVRAVLDLLVAPRDYAITFFGNYGLAHKPAGGSDAAGNHGSDLRVLFEREPALLHALAFDGLVHRAGRH